MQWAHGIYVLFEDGELAHGVARIVRIGTHTGDNQLPSRIAEHFVKENKDRSIFRKNIGRALLNKDGDPFLDQWEIDLTTREARTMHGQHIDKDKLRQTEKRVSDYMQHKIRFLCFEIESKDDRQLWESRFAATVAQCAECRPSPTWLGRHSPKAKIRESGLWQEQHIDGQPLSPAEYGVLTAIVAQGTADGEPAPAVGAFRTTKQADQEKPMLHDARLCFIGSGAMGGAIISGLLNKKVVGPGQIIASDPVEKQRQAITERFGITVVAGNSEAAKGASVIVLAVKPQVLPAVLRDLRGHVDKGALVLSIVAGARASAIAKALAHPSVVRSMPNTPAQVGEGITVWMATAKVTDIQREQARTILTALGKEIYVDDEKYLDMATAVSGTGPTYVFLMMEALIDAAVHLGFSRAIARDLVVQTVLGSAIFARDSDRHMAELRNMVTSPGGTSAEALYQLEKGSIRTVLSKAVWSAYQRSVVLGDVAAEAMAEGETRSVGDEEMGRRGDAGTR